MVRLQRWLLALTLDGQLVGEYRYGTGYLKSCPALKSWFACWSLFLWSFISFIDPFMVDEMMPSMLSQDSLKTFFEALPKWDGPGLCLLDVMLAGGESLTTLSVEAARKALLMAKVDPDDVGLVLLCTSTPEDLFGNAPQVLVEGVSLKLLCACYAGLHALWVMLRIWICIDMEQRKLNMASYTRISY